MSLKSFVAELIGALEGARSKGGKLILLPAPCPYEICCRNSHVPSLRKIR
jgi:hypothetical protein